MKLSKILSLAALSTSLLMVACEKDEFERVVPQSFEFSTQAKLKYLNILNGTTPSTLFGNDVRLAGAAVGFAGTFPSSTTYAGLVPGSYKLVARDTNTAAPKFTTEVTSNLESNKYYTLFLYDTIISPKTLMVNDEVTIPTDTVSRVRFVHLSRGGTNTNVDIFSQRLQKVLFSNVKFTDVTGFVDHLSKQTDTFYVRPVGATTPNLNTLVLTPDQRRNYTLYLRGHFNATAGAVPRALSFYTNY